MGNKLCKPCGKRYKKIEQAGSVLDRVISQASNEDQCLLYKLANYKKGNFRYEILDKKIIIPCMYVIYLQGILSLVSSL